MKERGECLYDKNQHHLGSNCTLKIEDCGVRMRKKKQESYSACVPKHEVDSFARCIFPAIQAYFNSEVGKREFAEWKEKQQESEKSA